MSDLQGVLNVIVDPTRRAILDALREQNLFVNEICEHFLLTQGAVSQHLKVLRDVDLVRVKRVGRRRLYEANPLPLLELFQWVAHYQSFWPKKLDRLGNYLDMNFGKPQK